MNHTQRTLRTADDLLSQGYIDAEDLEKLERVSAEFAVAITPQIQRLIDLENHSGPITAQFVPSEAELQTSAQELRDPIGDAVHSPLPGIVHRYPDRVLLIPLLVCPVYCRFCFRRESVGTARSIGDEELDAAIAYIRSHTEIWEVVISGGDPLILSPRRIRRILEALSDMAHVGVVRLHTRVPVVKPAAISDVMLKALRIAKAVYVVLHVNHASELSAGARQAIGRLVDAGIPMLSQTVLLKGVNADPDVLKALFRSLVELRVKPYYLHHADLARGTQHFRTTLAEGQAIADALRGHLSGLCQPLYVLDIPGGHGKVPIGPSYVATDDDGAYWIRDYRGRRHRYEDPDGS